MAKSKSSSSNWFLKLIIGAAVTAVIGYFVNDFLKKNNIPDAPESGHFEGRNLGKRK